MFTVVFEWTKGGTQRTTGCVSLLCRLWLTRSHLETLCLAHLAPVPLYSPSWYCLHSTSAISGRTCHPLVCADGLLLWVFHVCSVSNNCWMGCTYNKSICHIRRICWEEGFTNRFAACRAARFPDCRVPPCAPGPSPSIALLCGVKLCILTQAVCVAHLQIDRFSAEIQLC